MKNELNIAQGQEVVNLFVAGHTHLRVLDARGDEVFRFDSRGQHVTAVLKPGAYSIETDGKLGDVRTSALEPYLRNRNAGDAGKPPKPKQ